MSWKCLRILAFRAAALTTATVFVLMGDGALDKPLVVIGLVAFLCESPLDLSVALLD